MSSSALSNAGAGKAYGGLRLKQFVDAFHGQTFSICQGDFGPALASLGAAIAQRACLPAE